MINLGVYQQRFISILANHNAILQASQARNFLRSVMPSDHQKARNLINSIDIQNDALANSRSIYMRFKDFGLINGEEPLSFLIKGLLEDMGENEDAEFLEKMLEMLLPVSPIQTVTSLPSKIIHEPIEMYVFLSYAHHDIKIAREVEKYLVAAGIRVFQDEKVVKGGNWVQLIDKALNETTRMILLLSPASMPYRREVFFEWNNGYLLKDKCIHPLLIQDCKIHTRLQHLNYIDARTNLDNALKDLIQNLVEPCNP